MNILETTAAAAFLAVCVAALNFAAGYFEDTAGLLHLIRDPGQLEGELLNIESPAERALNWREETQQELAPVFEELGIGEVD